MKLHRMRDILSIVTFTARGDWGKLPRRKDNLSSFQWHKVVLRRLFRWRGFLSYFTLTSLGTVERKDILFILTLTRKLGKRNILSSAHWHQGEIEDITSEEGHTFYPHLDIKGNSGEEGIHFYSHLDSRGVLGLGKNTVFCKLLKTIMSQMFVWKIVRKIWLYRKFQELYVTKNRQKCWFLALKSACNVERSDISPSHFL